MRAVLDLLALLGEYLVRDRYGIAAGLIRLVARSGRRCIGDGALVGGRIDHTRLGDGLVLELHVALVAAQRSGGNGEQRGAVRAGGRLDLLALCPGDFLVGVVVQGVLSRAALVGGIGRQRVADHHVLLIEPAGRVVLAGRGLVAVHIGGPGHHPSARVLAAVNVCPREVGIPGGLTALLHARGPLLVHRVAQRVAVLPASAYNPKSCLVTIGPVKSTGLGCVLGDKRRVRAKRVRHRRAVFELDVDLYALDVLGTVAGRIVDHVVGTLGKHRVPQRELDVLKQNRLLVVRAEGVLQVHVLGICPCRHNREIRLGLPRRRTVRGRARRAHKLLGDPDLAAHGVVRGLDLARRLAVLVDLARVVHQRGRGLARQLRVIDDAVRKLGICIGKPAERIRKAGGTRRNRPLVQNRRARSALVDGKAALVGLVVLERVGKNVAVHVGLDVALVERNRPRDVIHRTRTSGLADHVVTEVARLLGHRAGLRTLRGGAAPRPRCRVLGVLVLVDPHLVAQCIDRRVVQARRVGDLVGAFGEIAQCDGCLLAGDRGLRVERRAIEFKTACIKGEVGTQRIGKYQAGGVRLDLKLHGPLDLVGVRVVLARLLTRHLAVLDGHVLAAAVAGKLDLDLLTGCRIGVGQSEVKVELRVHVGRVRREVGGIEDEGRRIVLDRPVGHLHAVALDGATGAIFDFDVRGELIDHRRFQLSRSIRALKVDAYVPVDRRR